MTASRIAGAAAWLPFEPRLDVAGARRRYMDYAEQIFQSIDTYDEWARADALNRIRYDLARPELGAALSAPTRAAVLVLVDLVAQGWGCRRSPHGVEVAPPSPSANAGMERERVRAQLLVQRDRQLRTPAVRTFVNTMERRRFHRGHWVSVFSLMRDGAQLAAGMRRLRDEAAVVREGAYESVIRPYLQVIQSDDTCEFTGYRLADIWRYFRCTWATSHRSTPGRSLMVLVRDAVVDAHPVVGIAALASSAVQIGVRDEWIGWAPDRVLDSLKDSATERHVRWLLNLIEDGLAHVYVDDLLADSAGPLTSRTLARPTEEVLSWLDTYRETQRDIHERLASGTRRPTLAMDGRPDDAWWRRQAETPLFRSKRAETLAILLRARLALCRGGRVPSVTQLRSLLIAGESRQAVQALVRRAKSVRVGVAIADINVCGALPPYAALLGGKLVAMLLLSPEIVASYRSRYATTRSVIASSLAGRSVVRPPHLVYLGTTSLYGIEPTQYTRVSLPAEALGGRHGENLRYHMLGRTQGYSTLQFSPETVEALSTFLAQTGSGQRVRSIFGEGVNPRLRKVRDGLDRLGVPADVFLGHGSARLVYGVPLARNFREYLLGLQSNPDYLVPEMQNSDANNAITHYWVQRWLLHRIGRADVLERVAQERITYPIQHGARVPTSETGFDQLSLLPDIHEG